MSRLMVSISGVRGIVGEDLDPLVVARWAAAFSGELPGGAVVVGRDSRPSGELLSRVATDLLQTCGRDVWDLGIVPTPTVQISVERWKAAGGLILTASHNPAEWNALKFVGPDGSFLSPVDFGSLRDAVDSARTVFFPFERWGRRISRHDEALELHATAIERVLDVDAIRRQPARILLDCVHGAGGVLLPGLLRRLGAKVEVLHGEAHGRFPREPEPTGPALQELAREAERCGVDFALAVDPDADRCAVAIPGTEVIGEEWTLPLVTAHLLSRRKGTLVTNLSTSTRLEAVAAAHGASVERTPVGEAHVVARMREIGAVLGGEGNGGVIDPQVHLGRDAAVAAAWLLEAHARHPGGLAALASTIPSRYVRKNKRPIREGEDEEAVLRRLEPLLGKPDDRRDGLRWSRKEGFVHVRFSATEPVMRVVVEAPSRVELERLFGELMEAARTDPGG